MEGNQQILVYVLRQDCSGGVKGTPLLLVRTLHDSMARCLRQRATLTGDCRIGRYERLAWELGCRVDKHPGAKGRGAG